jgi:hypothetical protein
MSLKKLSSIIVAVVVLSSVLFWHLSKLEARSAATAIQTPSQPISAPVALAPATALTANPPRSRVKHRASEFTADQEAEFMANFEGKYKPAIAKWCNVFNGHVPFTQDEVTAEKLVERIGIDSAYSEYIFVVDGITLGVQDTKNTVQVDYLNDPEQTKKMATLPDGTHAPTVDMLVTREEIVKMLDELSGTQIRAQDIRMTPSGLSGSLNGGVLANLGGDPENGASWKYDMVFGPDGKLAYYLRGHQ